MKTAVSFRPRHDAEYSLYLFDRTAPGRWEKHQSFREHGEALRRARHLYGTGHYPKIEIKMTYFDRRTKRQKDVTLRTFGRKARKQGRSPLGTVAIAILFGLIALILTYLSGHG